MRAFRYSCLLLLLLAYPLMAQNRGDLDFLNDLPDFQNLRRMLPEFLNSKAREVLRQRQDVIARFSSAQDVNVRKSYLREKMLNALGGFPERTPLNAQSVGVLEREDYKIGSASVGRGWQRLLAATSTC